jgi:hypothetical protein
MYVVTEIYNFETSTKHIKRVINMYGFSSSNFPSNGKAYQSASNK